ncbi:spermatogenesis-defective protein 39 homolog isoform X2 [Copidosoma floridanum]|uniref:spermatogenesis-defective protein 39 homolog isoform X2 n=1 Tax=Copidosoma floridanum TaxID=29053 RepID=UPI0006C9E1F2|nr:spermatogenesis-defective protein 39 homolog isoform X2 [Copidosoma floridanum]
MASSNDDDDFWYSTEKRSFCFESNETDNLFGVSKSGTAQLRAGISSIQITDSSVKYNEPQGSVKPLLSIISDSVLSKILEADKSQYIPDESSSMHPDDTLKRILVVQKLLVERPEALYTYIHYLSIRLCSSEICDLLTAQGKTVDAAIRCLNITIKSVDNLDGSIDPLLLKISKQYNMLFTNLPDCRETVFVQSYVKLLEWQKHAQNKLIEPFKANLPALEYLRLTCKDFWGVTETNAVSPLALAQNQDISPRQFEKVAIVTRASVHAWDDIDNLLHKKGWLGGKKLQTHLPIEEVLRLLQEHKAPSGIMEKFLNYVDSSKRLQVAKNLNCYKAVINLLMSHGDRTALLEYKADLRPHSEEYFYAESILCSNSIKWRN